MSKRAPHSEIGGACRLRPRRISNDPAAIEAAAGTARSFSCGNCSVFLYMGTIDGHIASSKQDWTHRVKPKLTVAKDVGSHSVPEWDHEHLLRGILGPSDNGVVPGSTAQPVGRGHGRRRMVEARRVRRDAAV